MSVWSRFQPMLVPSLETERLVLRGLTADDIEGFYLLYGDAEHARFVGGAKSRYECWEKLTSLIGTWQVRGFGRFAVEEKSSGRFLGHCGPSLPGFIEDVEINYSFVPIAQGKGFASEAATRVLRHVYEDLGYETAVSLIDPENTKSLNVAKRLGATPDGTASPHEGYTAQVWRHLPREEFLENAA